MGLDQYLYLDLDPSAKLFPPALTNTDFPQELRNEAADEFDRQYVSEWVFSGDPDPEWVANLDKFGVHDLVTPDSPHGYVNDRGGFALVVAYWRKANAIHKWFVQNVQDGVDECQYSRPVSAEELAHLTHLCREELAASPSERGKLLTPTAGFFFGSTEVDEWYIDDLKRTVARLEAVIQWMAKNRITGEFRYHSSW